MRASVRGVYWDSCCFLRHLCGQPGSEELVGVIQMAAEGKLRIYTSTVTLIEVLGDQRAGRDEIERIRSAFTPGNGNGIVVVDFNAYIAHNAREFIWEHKFHKHRVDAAHIATAAFLHERGLVDELHTFDGDILKFDGRLGMRIVEPSRAEYPAKPEQLEMDM